MSTTGKSTETEGKLVGQGLVAGALRGNLKGMGFLPGK